MYYKFMVHFYGGLFNAPEIDSEDANKVNWLLSSITVDQCKSGIQKIKGNPPKHPPVPAHFVRLCLGLDSSNDHKAIHDDYMQNHSHKSLEELRRFNWPSPLAYFVTLASADEIKKLHLVKLGNHDSKKTMGIFEKHYQRYAPKANELVIPEALVEDQNADPSLEEVTEDWKIRGYVITDKLNRFRYGPSQEKS